MSKIRFLGESDENFTNGNIYELIKIETTYYEFKTFISDDNNKLVYIPYSSIDTFNDNWEFVEEG